MEEDRFGTRVEVTDGMVAIRLDPVTASWLWEALYAFGEHVAAGAKVETVPDDMSDRLGSFMKQLSSVVHRRGGDS
ncbi:hypothetical protein RM555_15795 [Micromonospora sp. DSM 115977]|uniref:WYL domain-containing protein n=1 Tax=Micromonospora reichwaldensis TaxID=3075516 RepID=A0ABU2WX04_9ACTN|nr:hypothetical protein [Micromonospora sp. DSM 115977]MDT0530455.1 hypothetical protein [Micromonospora sp. DSM 115977]